MYLKKMCIQNYGPLLNFILDMPFKENLPKPLIIVGKNGTGKTIILSHLVNAALLAKQSIYDDCEIEKGQVYKVRSPLYINSFSDCSFSYARLEFENNNCFVEYLLNKTKKEIEKQIGFSKPDDYWDRIDEASFDFLSTDFVHEKNAREFIDENVIKYFPANRNIDPAWRNENFSKKQNFEINMRYRNISNRNIISYNDFEKNKQWLMDLLFDISLLNMDKKFDLNNIRIYKNINQIVCTLFPKYKSPHLVISLRKLRMFQINDENKTVLPNLSQLSLGEALLLNLFLSIISDSDKSLKPVENLSEMTGIVIIDEIENHLHNCLIAETLPRLIKLFPKIQFIITSHSPVFLLGMEKEFNDNFEIIELDSHAQNGYEIKTAEQFSEFKEAFNIYVNTNSFYDEINKTTKPVIITEGKTDKIIIEHAWSVLHKNEIIPFDIVGLSDETGNSGADAVNNILSSLPFIPGKTIIGLFDNDEKGLKCFKSIKKFTDFRDNYKIKTKNNLLFATCLPIPDEKLYMEGKKEGFEIEDYFPDHFLKISGKSKKVINIYTDSNGDEQIDKNMKEYQKFSSKKKKEFAESISTIDNKDGIFNGFNKLFEHLMYIITEAKHY